MVQYFTRLGILNKIYIIELMRVFEWLDVVILADIEDLIDVWNLKPSIECILSKIQRFLKIKQL